VEWVVLSYRLPSEPSRVRVGVWRELRRLGYVSLGAGGWTAPATPVFTDGLPRVLELIEAGGGQVLLLDATARDEATAARLRTLLTGAAEEAWTEFLSECDKYVAEVHHEVEIGKFTLSELDEEEHSLERLRRWHRLLALRDVFGADSAAAADRALKDCGQALDDYAERVFRAVGG
jgi:hypothetical protein